METVIWYLRSNSTSTIMWLLTLLAWVLWFIGVPIVGHWILVSGVTIFILIMIIGQLKDKIEHLEKQLDKFKI